MCVLLTRHFEISEFAVVCYDLVIQVSVFIPINRLRALESQPSWKLTNLHVCSSCLRACSCKGV